MLAANLCGALAVLILEDEQFSVLILSGALVVILAMGLAQKLKTNL